MAWTWFDSGSNLSPYIPCLLFLYYMYNNFFIHSLKVNLLLFRGLMNIHRIHDWFAENHLSVNGNLYMGGPWLSGMSFLITCGPTNVRHILTQNFQNYPKGNDFREIFEVLGDGILNIDGELWRHQSHELQCALSQKVFRTFVAKTTPEKVLNAVLPFLLETVERGLTIDLQDMFARLLFDISCILSFATDTSCLSIDLPDVPFAKAVEDSEAALFTRIVRPAACWKLFKFLGVGQEKELAKARVVIDQFLAEVVEQRKREMNEGKPVCPDLLSSYVIDEDSPNSSKFLRDLLLNFLVEGRDTVTSGLTWFFWALSQNKQAEEKILDELSSVHHSITPEGMISFNLEELENLVYLKAAFMESLRLYPSIPLNFRTVLKPDLLPSGLIKNPLDSCI